MNNSRKIVLTGLIFVINILATSSQDVRLQNNETISEGYKNISYYGLNEFINMDLGLIGYFPTIKHWTRISDSIKRIPIDSLRYIDSLDINNVADTMYVKVYSQNYAYQSRNIYKIAKNGSKSTDTLMIYHFTIDLKMKDIIADAETFRTKNFSIDFITKQNIENIDKRIVINKNYR